MSETAYTVGYREGYDASLSKATEANPVYKVGQRDDYKGGWVWKNRYGALAFIRTDTFENAFPGRQDEFAVYELELPNDWETDVYGPDAEGIYYLRSDARIVARVEGRIIWVKPR